MKLTVVMLTVVMLTIVMLTIVMLTIVMLTIVMLTVVMLTVFLLTVDMLTVVMLTVVMLTVVIIMLTVPFNCYTKCCYAEFTSHSNKCHLVESHGTTNACLQQSPKFSATTVPQKRSCKPIFKPQGRVTSLKKKIFKIFFPQICDIFYDDTKETENGVKNTFLLKICL
jgi:hypothetical protein